MGVGRIFFRGVLGVFSKIFPRGSKVVKFCLSHSKLRKPFLLKFSKSRGLSPPIRRPWTETGSRKKWSRDQDHSDQVSVSRPILVSHRLEGFKSRDFEYCKVLSSRCILNMKRLLTRTNNPFKISSKFRQQPGSLSIISLNSQDKEEALEHQKSHHLMDWIPGEWSWNKVTTKNTAYKDVVLCIYLNHCVFILHT